MAFVVLYRMMNDSLSEFGVNVCINLVCIDLYEYILDTSI